MNIRSKAILSALEYLDARYPNEPLNIVEIGCMFWSGEGLSTLLVAQFLSQRPQGGRFISIDLDPEHIQMAKEIVNEREPALQNRIDYRQGNSLTVLPGALTDLGKLHCFLQDGGAHPEGCLVEFEMALSRLVPDGVILVDDAQPIPPSSYYPWPRLNGKATLILPVLILSSFLELRSKRVLPELVSNGGDNGLGSELIDRLQHCRFPDFSAFSYCVIGVDQRLLLFGTPAFVERLKDPLERYAKRQSRREARDEWLRKTWIWRSLAWVKNCLRTKDNGKLLAKGS